MRRGKPDLETAISFLCSRASKSDAENRKQLNRVLSWVKETIDDKRIIGSESLTEV